MFGYTKAEQIHQQQRKECKESYPVKGELYQVEIWNLQTN